MNKQQTAQYIYQIISASAGIMGSWGASEISATEYDNMYGLKIKVNGFEHTGNVIITLNTARDLFDIFLFNDKDQIIKILKGGAYIDNLVGVLDELIETGNMSDEMYQKKVNKWLNETF